MGGERLAAFEHFLFSLPNLELVPPSYLIAREASRLRTPDALLVATAGEAAKNIPDEIRRKYPLVLEGNGGNEG